MLIEPKVAPIKSNPYIKPNFAGAAPEDERLEIPGQEKRKEGEGDCPVQFPWIEKVRVPLQPDHTLPEREVVLYHLGPWVFDLLRHKLDLQKAPEGNDQGQGQKSQEQDQATLELVLAQRLGEIHQKGAGAGPEQSQRNGQEGVACEEDDRKDPGQKDLQPQGYHGDNEKNQKIHFPLKQKSSDSCTNPPR